MGESFGKSFYCIFALLVVSLAFLLQLLVVGLFFALPYYTDCDRSPYVSPLQLSSCLTNSSHSNVIIFPPTCTNDSLTVPYCFDSQCFKRDTGCIPNARCCCRPVPQTRTVACMSGGLEVSLNASCVYAVCDDTAHAVLLQVYDASQLNNSSRTGIAGLFIQFGSYSPVSTDGNGIVRFNPVFEGDYAITVLNNDQTGISTEYFHASTLSINFYSPSQIVYIVYVKNLINTPKTSTILTCTVSSSTSISTIEFANTLSDLITLPNNFIFKDTFFAPSSLAYTTATQSVSNLSIDVNCTANYTLFYYTREGRWIIASGKTLFSLNSSVNALLWSLSVTQKPAYTVYINPGTSPLTIDSGSVLVLTSNNWFVSRVTSHNRTTLAVPFVKASSIDIRYTTSSYSHIIPASPVVNIGSLSSLDFTNNCSDNVTNTHYIVDQSFAVLSVTNSPNLEGNCYHAISVAHNNSYQNITFALSLRSASSIVYFSTLRTNSYYACLPYPCQMADFLCEISASNRATTLFHKNCTVASNSLGLLECNSQLQNLKFQS